MTQQHKNLQSNPYPHLRIDRSQAIALLQVLSIGRSQAIALLQALIYSGKEVL